MGLRRKARELAVQTLYALDYTDITDDFREFELLNAYPEILELMASHEDIKPEQSAYAFADELIRNTIIHLDEVEAKLAAHSQNWTLDRIAHIDKSILRVAIYEMLYTSTPPAVIINEALEIAKKFSSESSNKFVNGILDAVHQELKFQNLSHNPK